MQVNREEPSRERPCWVLFFRNMQAGRRYGHYCELVEHEWRPALGRWQRTRTEPRVVNSPYQALKEADWVGQLPQTAYRRPAFNVAALEIVLPGFQKGLTYREIQREAEQRHSKHLSLGTISRLHGYAKEKGLLGAPQEELS